LNEFTGERVVPGKVDVDLWNEHFSRYAFASRFCAGKRVLDLGCGTGYGTAELARQAASAAGVDIADEAVAYARKSYPGISFEQASCTATPFESASFDVIVAFEVIEHLQFWRGLLEEARRLLAPNGVFLVSTPNRSYYNESRGQSGANPFHEHEFEYEEFRDELHRYFPAVTILMQNRVEAFTFQPTKSFPKPEVRIDASGPERLSHFFVAVCAAHVNSTSFVYIPAAANLLRDREKHIDKLKAELALKETWLSQAVSDRTTLQKLVDTLNSDLEQRNNWAKNLESELAETRDIVGKLQQAFSAEQAAGKQLAADYETKVKELEQDVKARTEWAQQTEQRLGAELQAKLNELAETVKLLDQAEATIEERSQWALDLQRHIENIRQSRWLKLGRMVGVGPVA
jgi:SAM-dependent methyltransferase